MHDPRLSYMYMSKDSLLQCMHEAAAKHGNRLISSISLQCKRKFGFNFVEPLWYGRSWPRSQSERGKSNLEWKKNTFILSNYNELVDFLSSGRETSWKGSWSRWRSISKVGSAYICTRCKIYTVRLCAILHIDLGLSILFGIIAAYFLAYICTISWCKIIWQIVAHRVYFAYYAHCNMQNMQNMRYNMQQYIKKYA